MLSLGLSVLGREYHKCKITPSSVYYLLLLYFLQSLFPIPLSLVLHFSFFYNCPTPRHNNKIYPTCFFQRNYLNDFLVLPLLPCSVSLGSSSKVLPSFTSFTFGYSTSTQPHYLLSAVLRYTDLTSLIPPLPTSVPVPIPFLTTSTLVSVPVPHSDPLRASRLVPPRTFS